MSKTKVAAVVGLGVAGWKLYQAFQEADQAAVEYHERGPKPEVLLWGVVALVSLFIAFQGVDAAVTRAKRAF